MKAGTSAPGAGLAVMLVALLTAACRPDAGNPRATTTSVRPTTTQSSERPECRDLDGRFSRALTSVKSDSPVERLAEIRAAAVAAGEDPAGCVASRLADLVTEQRRRLVTLIVDDRAATPAAIYECPQVGPNLRCDGAVADDTAHLAAASVAARAPARSVRMELARGYAPVSATPYVLKARTGSPETITLPLRSIPAALHAIVVVVEEADAGYVKYVWLVSPH